MRQVVPFAVFSLCGLSCQTDYLVGAFVPDAGGSNGEDTTGAVGPLAMGGRPGGVGSPSMHGQCLSPCPFPDATCVAGECVAVQPPRGFAVGNAATCLDSEQGVVCAGQNLAGQLGVGEQPDKRLTFAPVITEQGLQRVVGMVGDHFMAHSTEGSAYVWGNNYAGALGVGDLQVRYRPTLLARIAPWSLLAPGSGHSCALSTDGRLWCFGRNADGELGTGDTSEHLEPVLVAGDFASVSVGWGHTCALSFEGQLFCWGLNDLGQLGLGDTESRPEATPVGTMRFRFISAEAKRTCAIDLQQRLHCWGDNQSGQAGVGTREPVLEPALVVGDESYSMVAGGYWGACAVSIRGGLYCWGKPADALQNEAPDRDRLVPERIGSLDDWSWVKYGYATACAQKTDESTWCWGTNIAGQLGTGDEVPREFPEITGPHTLDAEAKNAREFLGWGSSLGGIH